MPFEQTYVEPEHVVGFEETGIYRTYKCGDIEQPYDYHYSYNREDTDGDCDDGHQFDIRELFCYADTPPVTCCGPGGWSAQKASHKAILMELLEKGIIDSVDGIVIPKDSDGKLRTNLQNQISNDQFSGAISDKDLVIAGKAFSSMYRIDGGPQMIPAPDGENVIVNVTIGLMTEEKDVTILELRGITIPITGTGDERKADLSFLKDAVVKAAEEKLAQLSLELKD